MARKIDWTEALDGNLLDAVREAQKMVNESQSSGASAFDRTRYSQRVKWLKGGMEELARRGLLHAL